MFNREHFKILADIWAQSGNDPSIIKRITAPTDEKVIFNIKGNSEYRFIIKFGFDDSEERRYLEIERSPGLRLQKEFYRCDDFPSLFSAFGEWATLVKRDMSIPDPWEEKPSSTPLDNVEPEKIRFVIPDETEERIKHIDFIVETLIIKIEERGPISPEGKEEILTWGRIIKEKVNGMTSTQVWWMLISAMIFFGLMFHPKEVEAIVVSVCAAVKINQDSKKIDEPR